MVKRNPKGIASFSTSLISVVTGISGTPSIPRAQFVNAAMPVSDAHTPTMEEREAFFTDVMTVPTQPIAIVPIEEPTAPEYPAAAITTVEPIAEVEAAVDAPTASEPEPVDAVMETAVDAPSLDLNISLADYLDTTPAAEDTNHSVIDSTPDEIDGAKIVDFEDVQSTLEDDSAYPSDEDEMTSDLVEMSALAAPETFDVVIHEDTFVPNSDAEAASDDHATVDTSLDEIEAVQPVDLPAETIVDEAPVASDSPVDAVDTTSVEDVATIEADPVVNEAEVGQPAAEAPAEPLDVTESVVRAVLEQFEQQSGTTADPDLIRSVTEQVAAQMAAQQTAMRIAQQVLSSQPVAPIVVQQPVVQQPVAQMPPMVVPGVPVPGVPVQPAAAAPVAPQSIPGFDPSAYLAGAAPAAPAYPVQPVVMPAPVQYQMPAPVWTPPTGAPVPMPAPAAPAEPQYIAPAPTYAVPQYVEPQAAPAPAPAPQDSMHMDNMTVYASEATVVYEPTAEEVNAGPVIPSIEAFDPSAYLGMNAVPSLEPVAPVQEEVAEEPTWEPVYEFAPVDEAGTPIEEAPEAIQDREQRRAQQMLRELSALRDHRQ